MISGKISQIKNKNGDVSFPITSSKAVYMEDGVTTIDKKLDNIDSQMDAKANEINDIKLNFDGNYVNLSTFKNVTDYAPIINSLINDGFNILLPAKEILINSPIMWNGKVSIRGVNRQLSIIKASNNFTGNNVIDTTGDEEGVNRRKYAKLENFTIDANNKCMRCLLLRNGEGFNINSLNMYNATSVIMEMGINKPVNACNIYDLNLAGDVTYLKPFSSFPDYCLKVNVDCTDNNFSQIFAYDSKIAIFRDDGGSNRYVECHGWGTLLDEKFSNHIFQINSNNNELSLCFADSPKLAGFYIEGWGNKITNSKCLIYNKSGNMTSTVYVELGTNGGQNIISDCKFWYDGTQINKEMKVNGVFKQNIFSNNIILNGIEPTIMYYSKFKYPIFTGNNSFNFNFPTTVSSVAYSVMIDTTFDSGGYSIVKTVNGFTVNFKNTTTKQESIFVNLYFLY